jgi:diguanylate cyclase (GGDEF)-like protein
VARHGGEEFAVLLTNLTVQRAVHLAEELRERCASQLISSAGASAHITISIGLATSVGQATLPRIMSVADSALYAAKNGGRNRIAIASLPQHALPPLQSLAARAATNSRLP